MNEFIEKLIGRLEEEMAGHLNLYCDGLIKAMSVAKELAEEYNDGWISCENELPKENGYYLVTYRKNGELIVDTWYFNGRNFNQVDEIDVIAWQLVPASYKPKGE